MQVSQMLIVIGYMCYAIAAGVILLNVTYTYQTLRTGRHHSAVFLITSIFAFLGCNVLRITPRGCTISTLLIFVALDFATPVLAHWFFKLIGV
ncbi:MAG: hypothetical protein ACE5G5_13505, partial [Candidatus Methylomirabilales bacterium]